MPERGARTHIDTAAYHEAGHAVAGLWEGRRVVQASVRLDLPGNGMVRSLMSRGPNPFDPAMSPGTAKAAWRHTLAIRGGDIRLLLAGPLAEAKALGQPLRSVGSRSDFEKCERLADELDNLWCSLLGLAALPQFDKVKFLNEQRVRVRRWLGRPKVWYLVSRVVHRLSREGVLDGQALLRELATLQLPPGQRPLALHGRPPSTRVLRSPAGHEPASRIAPANNIVVASKPVMRSPTLPGP